MTFGQYMLVYTLVCGNAVYLSTAVILDAKLKRSSWLVALMLWAAALLVSHYMLGRDSPWATLLTILLNGLICFLSFGKRGWSLVISAFIVLVIEMLCDLAGGYTLLGVFGYQTFNDMRLFISPLTYLTILVPSLYMLLLAGVIAGVRTLWRRRKTHESAIFLHILRPITLLILTVVVTCICAARIRTLDAYHLPFEVMLNYLLFSAQTLVALSYIVQDIKYIAMVRSNRSLVQQQQINDALLNDMRIFRHNIGNLLYGFHGAALSGDMDEIRAYYDHMCNRCAMLNNENVYSLRLIPDAAVATVVLSKLHQASQGQLPFYIDVQPSLRWRHVHSAALCECLGVLLDNALESARECEVPRVYLFVYNTSAGMELHLQNTFAGDSVSLAPNVSTKAEHAGLGLASVQRIVERCPNLTVNQFCKGRFVHSVLHVD